MIYEVDYQIDLDKNNRFMDLLVGVQLGDEELIILDYTIYKCENVELTPEAAEAFKNVFGKKIDAHLENAAKNCEYLHDLVMEKFDDEKLDRMID